MFSFCQGFRDKGNLGGKDSLTDSGCLHDRAQAMDMDGAALQSTIISSQRALVITSLVLQSTTNIRRCKECAGGGGWRWHAAVGTVGGNCFPGIC